MLFHHLAEDIANSTKKNYGLNGWNIEALVVAPVAFVLLLSAVLTYDPTALRAVATAVALTSPVWLPISLFVGLWITWVDYIRFAFWFSQEMVLVEVILPPEIEKSPLSMELFLAALWNSGGEGTLIHRLWKGAFRPVWSLEIASNEGRVSYYIHMRASLRAGVEARLYGQFPEAKIQEVEDYAAAIPFNTDDYGLWGCEYTKTKAGALPIKTYIDYQLDKNPDTPEIQVDPLSNMLELLSSIGPGEHLWVQIICKARKNDEWYGLYDYLHDSYKDGGKKLIQDLMAGAAKRAQAVLKASEVVDGKMNALLTDGEKKEIEAVEKSMDKLTFECGIRSVYLTKSDKFNGANIGSIANLFVPFRSNDLNGLVPTRALAIFNYPWQDFRDIRKKYIREQLFFYYRNRAYFYVPYDQVPVFLNTEELASLWHFPNSKVNPPGLERVASKRAEAPANLPTGPANLPS